MEALLGETLQGKEGTEPTTKALAGVDAVGLYFSAHWCPPCKAFTPKLAEVYQSYKAKGLSFEIVFVSSDRDEEAFNEYFAEQPWRALPFAQRELKAKLSKKFKVSGIPTLVVVDAKGELITKDGRERVMSDPEGAEFPWAPPTLWEALGDEVLAHGGEDVSVSDLRGPGKVLALYFSASWCPPCHAFTPKLVETAEALRAAGTPLELVFVSSDKNTAEFAKYFETMRGFHAIPPGDKRGKKLSALLEVEGIPTLAIIDAETGAIINADARGAVQQGEAFPWRPAPVADLSSPDGINEETSLCVMLDGCTEEVRAAALAMLTPLAEASKAANEGFIFFAAKSSEGAVAQIRALTGLKTPSEQPQLVLMDIPDRGGFYVSEPAALTEESVKEFLASYKKGALTRQQLEN